MKYIQNIMFLLMLIATATSVNFAQTTSEPNAKFTFNLTDAENNHKTFFKVGEDIFIETFLENSTNEIFPNYETGSDYQYRFYLNLVGETKPVPYREDKAKLLSIREEKPGVGKQLETDPLFPGEKIKKDKLKLSDRYENLKEGKYKLKIEYKTGKLIVNKDNKMERLRLSYVLEFEILSNKSVKDS